MQWNDCISAPPNGFHLYKCTHLWAGCCRQHQAHSHGSFQFCSFFLSSLVRSTMRIHFTPLTFATIISKSWLFAVFRWSKKLCVLAFKSNVPHFLNILAVFLIFEIFPFAFLPKWNGRGEKRQLPSHCSLCFVCVFRLGFLSLCAKWNVRSSTDLVSFNLNATYAHAMPAAKEPLFRL